MSVGRLEKGMREICEGFGFADVPDGMWWGPRFGGVHDE